MPFELSAIHDGTIAARDMNDGDVGVITAWGEIHGYDGQLVQMAHGDRIVVLGESSHKGWNEASELTETCRVRLLEDGEQLTYRKPD